MDAETSRVLFDKGAMAVILDVPVGTEFGIDMHSWRTGDKFKGVKMIPPGVHMVHYSAVCRSQQQQHRRHDEEVAPRTAFFHNFAAGELLVRVWNRGAEQLEEPPDLALLTERLAANRHELDQFLGAYPYATLARWYALTGHITSALLARVLPLAGSFCAAVPLEPQQPTATARQWAECGRDADSLPLMQPVAGTGFRFWRPPTTTTSSSSCPPLTAAERTQLALDSSHQLQPLFDNTTVSGSCSSCSSAADGRGCELLGELQLAFVAFLVGHVHEAFEQWKLLVRVISSCDQLLRRQPRFFSAFIGCLHYQLAEMPDQLFVDTAAGQQNFLEHTLYIFFNNAAETQVPAPLRERAAKFRRHLEHKFGWDFSREPDEFAPVIVE